MRIIAIALVLTVLPAVTAAGAEQDLDRLFHFTHASAVQDLQEIATVIRSVTDIRQLTVDAASRSLAVRGTAAQVALAEWLFGELDRPIDRQAGTPVHDYRLPDSGEVARVFYLAHSGTPQELQEIATLIRSTADIRRLFTYHALRAVTVRGTAAQVALAEWLISELDKPADSQAGTTPREYRLPGGDDLVRIFYLAHANTPQRLQEIATQARAMTQIRRLFISNAQRAVVARGTGAQIALADRLIHEWDR